MKLTFILLLNMACLLRQCHAHKEFEVVKLFEKMAEEDEEKRTYGYHSEWSNTGISCISEFCTTVEGLIGKPSEPLYCAPEKIITMKTPPTENEPFDEEFEFKKSDNNVCLCNTSCYANLVEVKETNYANAVEKTEINSSVPINIISKSIIYQPNEYYEVKIISQPDVVQYLVIIRINMPCKYAFIRIEDFDDNDGEILLGDICGTKFLWLYLDVDPTKNLRVQIRVKQLQFLHFYITVIPLKENSNCKAPQYCTQLLNGYEGIFMSPNFGSDNKDLGEPNTNTKKEWRYRSCFKSACILRFLQLYPWNFYMKPNNQNGALINGCSGSHLKFEDRKWLEAKYSGSWLFTTGEYCYNGNTLGKYGTDNVNILTRKYSTTVDLVMVKTTIQDPESGYKLLFNKHNCETDATTQVTPYETSKPAENLVIELYNQTTTTTTESLENANPEIIENPISDPIAESVPIPNTDAPIDLGPEVHTQSIANSSLKPISESQPELATESIDNVPDDPSAENVPKPNTDAPIDLGPEVHTQSIDDSSLKPISEEAATDSIDNVTNEPIAENVPISNTDAPIDLDPEVHTQSIADSSLKPISEETATDAIDNVPDDPSAENAPEPNTDAPIGLGPEVHTQSIADSSLESIPGETATDSIDNVTNDPIVENVPEPNTDAPIDLGPEVHTQSIDDSSLKPVSESQPELATDSIDNVTNDPIAENVPESNTDAPIDLDPEVHTQSIADSSIKPVSEEAATDSIDNVTNDPIAENVPESNTDDPIDLNPEVHTQSITDISHEPISESQPELATDSIDNVPDDPSAGSQFNEQQEVLPPLNLNEKPEIENNSSSSSDNEQPLAIDTLQCDTCDMETCKKSCSDKGKLFGECSQGQCICAEYCSQYADFCKEVFYQKCPFSLTYCINGIKSTLKCYQCGNCCEFCQNQGKTPTCIHSTNTTSTLPQYTCNCI